jgi:pyroglutamyl-peptidase
VAAKILLTSFTTWRPHQRANSSDQLLMNLMALPEQLNLYFFRQLPVNLPVARDLMIAKLHQICPDLLLCCGMAESRSSLCLETQAVLGNQTLKTQLDVEQLVQGLGCTTISQDAGRFVCNSLYHAMLNYLSGNLIHCKTLFVHVPILTADNREQILQDFRLLIARLQSNLF